jgi:hypothetical protein
MSSRITGRRAVLATAGILGSTAAPPAQELGEAWGTGHAEAAYYRIVDLPIPPELRLEASSMCIVPDGRLAIGTRRGEILLVDGAFEDLPALRIERFAEGLDEVFGLGFHDGAFHVTQQTEVTRISDRDGDGRADRFENLSDVWGFGHYHEFSWGSAPDQNGDVWVVLGLSDSYHYKADYRGWAFRITPDGRSIPIASGVRSAGGVAPNEHGVMFYVESQGPWNGSCSLKHLRPGGFLGHPVSFPGYDLPLGRELGPRPAEPANQSRLRDEADRIEQLVPYAVVFPYRRMGQSITAFRPDRSGGRFGPFAGQLFVADFSLSLLMRATTEEVEGVWQGACYPFREGFGTGLLALEIAPSGHLVTGGTNRGWPVRGNRHFVLQRVEWTGRLPFEIERVSIRPDGFALTFTAAVDPGTAADPRNYRIDTFTHVYQQFYGSPEVDRTEPRVRGVEVLEDGRTVRLRVEGMVRGHVHSFTLDGVLSAEREALLHRHAHYTVNEIPR